MSKNLTWEKTMLSVYRYTERVSNALDRIFETRAMGGNVVTGNNLSYNGVVKLTSTLINLTDRKITLINLKLLIEKTLLSIDRQYAKILIQKYIEHKTSKEIGKMFDISTRSVFRKINVSLEHFRNALIREGYCECKIAEMLKKEKWIMEVYNRFEQKDTYEEDLVVSDDFIFSICAKMKRASLVNY